MGRNVTIFLRALIVLAAAAYAVRIALPDPRLTATVFDIGQGDAILVQCGSQQMLVDGGPDAMVVTRLGAAMPFFDRTIENVVLTHPHTDHYRGLLGTFARYKVLRFSVSGSASEAPEYLELLKAAHDAGAQIVALQAGDRIDLGECAHADVLWPDRSRAETITEDANTESVVMRVTRNDASSEGAAILLTGDATAEVEQALLMAKATLRADVLKVGHHGSRTSSTPEFLRAVSPVAAIMSLSKKNTFGHPSPVTLLRLRAIGANAYRTDRDGSVRAVIESDRAYVERGRPAS